MRGRVLDNERVTVTSAGLLPYRVAGGGLSVFIGHFGGPLWARKDAGAWTIVKGEYAVALGDPWRAACREFTEETGAAVPPGEPICLGELTVSRKRVTAYAILVVDELSFVASNPFPLEWPPRSGHVMEVPELDRAEWFDIEEAREKLVPGQRPFLDHLCAHIGQPHP